MYIDILYIESGDYVQLCELAKKYDMTDLAVRCEILACRHVSASDETARELLLYAEYLQLHTLWKASASHLLRSRFRDHQTCMTMASSGVGDNNTSRLRSVDICHPSQPRRRAAKVPRQEGRDRYDACPASGAERRPFQRRAGRGELGPCRHARTLRGASAPDYRQRFQGRRVRRVSDMATKAS